MHERSVRIIRLVGRVTPLYDRATMRELGCGYDMHTMLRPFAADKNSLLGL